MPNETNVSNPQAGNEQTPQAGTNDTPANPQAGEANPTSALTLDQAIAELTKVRKEAAANRVKLNEFEEKTRREAEAQMTEAQKATARASDLERKLSEATAHHQERTVQYEVQLHAAKLGIIDPDAAGKLIDWSQLEYDDNGTPKNAQKLLKDLITAKPYLAGTPLAGSAANPPRNNSTPNAFTESQIAAMSPQEYAKNKTAIFQAQREGRILRG